MSVLQYLKSLGELNADWKYIDCHLRRSHLPLRVHRTQTLIGILLPPLRR